MPRSALSTFVISYTVFDEGGDLDEQGQRAHFERLAEAGIGVYAVGGGSGEAYSLTPDEQARVLAIAADVLRDRVPVRAMGAPPRRAGEMIAFADRVAAAGLDGMQLYPPDLGMGHRPRDRELRAYYDDVLPAIRVPVILSTHMSLGYLLPVPLIADLAERYPHVAGVNVTTPDLAYLGDVVAAVGDRLEVHVGIASQALTAIALGASGFLSSEGNLAPRLCQGIIDGCVAGDYAGANDALGRVVRLGVASQRFGNVQAMKACLRLLELPGGVPRRPRLPLEDADSLAQLRALLDELDIARIEGLKVPAA
ncbi:MAG TPA: dihydrodipicolinate synthase family protein [Candidatus Angelobacter sp.]|nr:dihydrodipicolinate synthase family protein [Candidatus Angelobacter sp.]